MTNLDKVGKVRQICCKSTKNTEFRSKERRKDEDRRRNLQNDEKQKRQKVGLRVRPAVLVALKT